MEQLNAAARLHWRRPLRRLPRRMLHAIPANLAMPSKFFLGHDGTGAVMADTADRRLPINESSGVLKRRLNEDQLATLYTLERFGWELKFVRDGASSREAVLFDPDARKYAVLGVDGTVDDNPIFHRFR